MDMPCQVSNPLDYRVTPHEPLAQRYSVKSIFELNTYAASCNAKPDSRSSDYFYKFLGIIIKQFTIKQSYEEYGYY